jgi:purine nucleosidase/pyrimidine-specific ribonucleoside hydrolase
VERKNFNIILRKSEMGLKMGQAEQKTIGASKVILNCDPGHDDAVAILSAAASRELNLLGIMTVFGNSSLKNVTRNALALCSIANLNIPVCTGMSHPLIRTRIDGHRWHGSSGLDGTELPMPIRKIDGSALEFMAEKITENPKEITLVSTGPLTNIAALFMKFPEIIRKVKSVVFMGGGIKFGNVTPYSEFNIYADPEAASIVIRSPVRKIMFPLDVTHQAIIYKEDVQKIRLISKKSRTLRALADLLDYYINVSESHGQQGAPLHDPCPIIYMIDPNIFETNKYCIEIELRKGHTYGQTIVSNRKKPNTWVAEKVNRQKYIDMIMRLLESYSED